MSCQDCKDSPLHGAFLRVGDPEAGYANIEIVACEKHWRWSRERLLARRAPVSEDAQKLAAEMRAWYPCPKYAMEAFAARVEKLGK